MINGLIRVRGSQANLYLMNPMGIVFGNHAQLDIPGSFTATTADGIRFENGWFQTFVETDLSQLNGSPDAFVFTSSDPGSVVNAADLAVRPGSSLTLMGGSVINTGNLTAPGGDLTLAAVPGSQLVRLSQAGTLLSLEFEPLTPQQRDRFGTDFTPLSLPELLTESDISNASGLSVDADGTVWLTGSGLALPDESGLAIATSNGRSNAGILSVDSDQINAAETNVFGHLVALLDATLNASGDRGGGTIRIGGEYQGGDSVPSADTTLVDANSTLTANALDRGDGGRVIIWADDTTQFLGAIAAQGGLAQKKSLLLKFPL